MGSEAVEGSSQASRLTPANLFVMPQMRIVVLVGLPGSGKSSWLSARGAEGLSSDRIRGILADDETDQSIHDRVFQSLRYLLRHRLALGRPITWIDATNLTRLERVPYIGIGKSHGCFLEAVYFDLPVEVCRLRNAGRSRVVPDDVLTRMALKLEPPSLEEGFDLVTRAGI
jgi:predicted kinase